MSFDHIWEQLDSYNAENVIKTEVKQQCCDNFYNTTMNGFDVCSNCGLVNSRIVIDSDIFTFENGDNNKYLRQYDNHLFPTSSTSTKISGTSRIAKIQSWQSMPYNETVLWEISTMLKSILHDYFSPRVINDSLVLYKEFYEKSSIHRGLNKKGFVAVCVYIAASQNFATVTPKDVANILNVDNKIVHKCIQKYSEIMNVPTNCNRNPKDFLEGFITKMGLHFKIRKIVLKILEYIEKYQILGGSMPQNVCISSIAFVCKEMGTPLDLNMLTQEFNISITTVDKILLILETNKQKMFKNIKASKN
jgi:transcription initiation factor TFIIIB Brf1 subunit/transcription initiation factor TFIIB